MHSEILRDGLKDMTQAGGRLRHVASKGFSIAVYGPDGAGKSTVLDWIEEELSVPFAGRIRRSHIRPHRVPNLARLRSAVGLAKSKRAGTGSSGMIDPYAAPMPGRLKSLIRFGWFFADFAIDGIVKMRPTSELRLYDRFVEDYLIDPRRHRLNLPAWFLKAALKPIPRPDLNILLVGNAERIAARKGEQTADEARRQITLLEAMARQTPRSHLLNTDCPTDETRQRLRLILAEHGPVEND